MVPPPSDSLERGFWAAIFQTHLPLPDSEVRNLALGVAYLRLLSVQFERRRGELRLAARDPRSVHFARTESEREAVLERPDAYRNAHVAWVPAAARWDTVRITPAPLLARALGGALLALELENPSLDGLFPRDYQRVAVRPEVLAGWVRIIDGVGVDGASGPYEGLTLLTRGRFEARTPVMTPPPGVRGIQRQRMNTLRSLTTGQAGFGRLLDRLDDQLRELDRLMEQNRKLSKPDGEA